jgi:hypothetical protein
MDNEVDINELRKALIDYYGTGATSGIASMFMEVVNIEKMSDDEIVRKAKEDGLI